MYTCLKICRAVSCAVTAIATFSCTPGTYRGRGEEEVVLELQLDIVPREAKFQVSSIKNSNIS